MPAILSLADGTAPPWPRLGGGRGTCLQVCAGQRVARTVSVAVRTCQRLESPSARTYSGQRRRNKHRLAVFVQVREHIEVQAGAVCKTVGSAYVGSNPTPATTCENGPLAAETRPAGRFLLVTPCISEYHRGPMRSSGYGNIADSVRAERAVRITARFADRARFVPLSGRRDCSCEDVPDIPVGGSVFRRPAPAGRRAGLVRTCGRVSARRCRWNGRPAQPRCRGGGVVPQGFPMSSVRDWIRPEPVNMPAVDG
jgi:hypothetical protein